MGNEIILYCGSFNPIHSGHLQVALDTLEQTGSMVRLVPAWQNPQKSKYSVSFDDRLKMTKMAVLELVKKRHLYPSMIVVDSIEETLKPKYTSDLLAYYRSVHDSLSFSLLIGSDNLLSFVSWHNWTEILDNHGLYVYARPGYEIPPDISDVFKDSKHIFKIIQGQGLPVSSTDIRSSRNFDRFLPNSVLEYIDTHGLYPARDP